MGVSLWDSLMFGGGSRVLMLVLVQAWWARNGTTTSSCTAPRRGGRPSRPHAMPRRCRRRRPLPRKMRSTGFAARPVSSPASNTKGHSRVLIPLWDSLMFGRVPGTRPNISESHSEISTRVPFCTGTRPNISKSHSEISTRVALCIAVAGTPLATSPSAASASAMPAGLC